VERGRRRLLGFIALVAAAVLAGALATPAQASPSYYVVMFSDPGDWIGAGAQRVFHPGNAAISLHGNAGYLTVGVSGGTLGDYYDLDFGRRAAPASTSAARGAGATRSRAASRSRTSVLTRTAPSTGCG
jgi:hypothetical protein